MSDSDCERTILVSHQTMHACVELALDADLIPADSEWPTQLGRWWYWLNHFALRERYGGAMPTHEENDFVFDSSAPKATAREKCLAVSSLRYHCSEAYANNWPMMRDLTELDTYADQFQRYPISVLKCCFCGSPTNGRQWWREVRGYGCCPDCAPEHEAIVIGIRGIHWDPEPSSRPLARQR